MDATTFEPPLSNKIEDLYNMMGERKNVDEEFEIKQSELDQLKLALKDETFRQMLSDYVEEVRDPENQMTYQSELRQLEKERGNILHFINPIAGYVLKTSVNGDKKGFINICSNPLIRKPSFEAEVKDNKHGSVWSIPYTQSQGREDYDKSGKICMVYDVIFNPEALQLADRNSILKQKLEETAIEAVETSFKLCLDKVNIRHPKLKYKGMRNPATIKYKIGEAPPFVLDPTQFGKELAPEKDGKCTERKSDSSENCKKGKSRKDKKGKSSNVNIAAEIQEPLPISKIEMDYSKWTNPKYALKYRSHVDMQNFCTEFQRQSTNSNVPDEIVLTIDLPLLKDSSSLDADVVEDGNSFELKSDEKALYYLNVKFPYKVIPDTAKASFDKDKRKLIVCMKIMKLINESTTVEASLKDLTLGEDEFSGKIGDDLEIDDGHGKDIPCFNDNGINSPLEPVFEDPFEEDNGTCSPEICSSLIGSPAEKKTVRFSDEVKQIIFRSNSSILGQRKKNQRKAKSRRKRLNSLESTSSVDEDEEFSGGGDGSAKAVRQRFYSGESVSSLDDEDYSKYSASY